MYPNSVAFLTEFVCRSTVTYRCNGKASKSADVRYLDSLISKDSYDSTNQAHEIKQTTHVLRLTKLYTIYSYTTIGWGARWRSG